MASYVDVCDNFDFDAFINYSEDNVETFDAFPMQLSASEPLSAGFCLLPDVEPTLVDDLGFNPSTTDFFLYDDAYPSPSLTVHETFAECPPDFRSVVDSWAQEDPRACSMKQKRRDAAIDLHLQRCQAVSDLQSSSTDLEGSYYATSSTGSRGSSQASPATSSFSTATPVSSSSRSEQPSNGPPSGGLQLVFDMNLNTATQLPKKQRKRTKAEIKDYINVRRNGACIKHRSQHKKCNCPDKVVSSPSPVINAKTKNSGDAPRRVDVVKAKSRASTRSLSSPSQRSSPQSSGGLDGLSWGDSVGISWGDSVGSSPSTLSPIQDMELSLSQESPHVFMSEQSPFTCLMPHCTFRTQSEPDLHNHYNMHTRPRRATSGVSGLQGVEAGSQNLYIRQAPSQQILQTRRPSSMAADMQVNTQLTSPGSLSSVSQSPSTGSLVSSSGSLASALPYSEARASESPSGIVGSSVYRPRDGGLQTTVQPQLIPPRYPGRPRPDDNFNNRRFRDNDQASVHQPLEDLAVQTNGGEAIDNRFRERSSQAKSSKSLEGSSWLIRKSNRSQAVSKQTSLLAFNLQTTQALTRYFGSTIGIFAIMQVVLAAFKTIVRACQAFAVFLRYSQWFTAYEVSLSSGSLSHMRQDWQNCELQPGFGRID